MPSDVIGSQRSTALYRLIGLVILAVTIPVWGLLLVILLALYLIGKLLKTLLLNDGTNGTILSGLRAGAMWLILLVKWALFLHDFPGFVPSSDHQ